MGALLVTNEPLTTLSDAPAQSAEAITPSDSAIIGPYRSLWIGGAGTLAAILVEDSASVSIAGIPAGTLLPIAVKKVLATGTTATLIIGLK